jgi:hypothetical protein
MKFLARFLASTGSCATSSSASVGHSKLSFVSRRRSPLLIVFSEKGRSLGTREHTEYASVRTPTAAPSSQKIFVFMAMRSKQALTHS